MAVKIDLLPSEFKIKGSYIRVSKYAKTIGLVLLSIYMLGGIFFVGYTLFLKSQTKSVQNRIQTLKSDIRKLEMSEQKIVLLKDRLSKIKSIMKAKSSGETLLKVKKITDVFDSDVTIDELKIETNKVEVSLSFSTIKSLNNFMAGISTNTDFDTIRIDNYSFNPNIGYQVGVLLFDNK